MSVKAVNSGKQSKLPGRISGILRKMRFKRQTILFSWKTIKFPGEMLEKFFQHLSRKLKAYHGDKKKAVFKPMEKGR